MEHKHTPGPWWVTDSGIRDSGGYICHTNPAFRYPGQDERYEREQSERAANKHLIAGAPDLLAGLEEAIDALADGLWDYGPGQDEHDKCNEVIEKLRAIVARSRGAQP